LLIHIVIAAGQSGRLPDNDCPPCHVIRIRGTRSDRLPPTHPKRAVDFTTPEYPASHIPNLHLAVLDPFSLLMAMPAPPQIISETKRRSEPPWLGGVAACMAVCITHPIDQTKIRKQTQSIRLSVLDTARASIRSNGVLGLWDGLSGSLLRQATYGAARFGIYGHLKETNFTGGSLVLNGAISGIVAGIVGAPAGKQTRRQHIHYAANCLQPFLLLFLRGDPCADVFRYQQTTGKPIELQELYRWSAPYLQGRRNNQNIPRVIFHPIQKRRDERESTFMASLPSVFIHS
jgi:hypothetical protein